MRTANARGCRVPGYMPMTEEQREMLWRDYQVAHEGTLRNSLVLEYMPIVKYLAEVINSRLPNSVLVDDLVSFGTFGLLDAIESFDIDRGVKFETFCAARVRGAILDGLRAQDWVPRITRARMRRFRRTSEHLETELGRRPTEEELAEQLGMDISELNNLLSEVTSVNIFSLSDSTGDCTDDSNLHNIDYIEDNAAPDPLEVLQKREIMGIARNCLDDKEFDVLDCYYNHEMTMRDIGARLGMSESRISQIHSKAIERLREHILRSERVSC